MMTDEICPLCKGSTIDTYCRDKFRDYLICQSCRLVFVPKRFHLSDIEEKERYDLHRNDPNEEGYRKFLSRIVAPLELRIDKGSQGLDFGCGPGPALSMMLRDAGYQLDTYDKFYGIRPEVFEKTYDFVTATEVVEHLRDPEFELNRLFALVRSGGLLGIMTKLVIDKSAFENWHYKRDMTHICFFSRPTFEWLGNLWKAKVEFIGSDVILIYKTL